MKSERVIMERLFEIHNNSRIHNGFFRGVKFGYEEALKWVLEVTNEAEAYL